MLQSLDVNAKKSFHANLIRFIQSHIREKLDEVVIAELENAREITPQTWKIIAHNVIKSAKESPAVISILENVQSILYSSIENVISNIENEPISDFPRTQAILQRPLSSEGIYRGCDGLQFERLALDTAVNKSLKVRKEALNMFNQTVLSEVVSSQSWPHIRRNLRDNLYEENLEIFNLSLNVHARLMQSTSQLCIKEGFINLVEGLRMYYSKTHHSALPTSENGIDLTDSVHHHLCEISYLILEATKEMPKNWLRCGERRVEEIVGVFVTLIAMHLYDTKFNYSKSILYPFHILSLLDPKAKWCTQWLHGTFSQHLFLNTLSQNSTLINFVVEKVLSYLEHHQNEHLSLQDMMQQKISSSVVKYATFMHSLSILNKIVPYEKRYNFFPVVLKPSCNSFSLEDIVINMIQYNNSERNHSSQVFSLSTASPILREIIKKVLQNGDDEIRENIFKALFGPVYNRNIQQTVCLNIPSDTIEILLGLTEDSIGILLLLGKKQKMHIAKTYRNQNSVSSSAGGIRRNRSTSISSDREYSASSIRIPSTSNIDASPAKIIECVTTTALRNHDTSNVDVLVSLLKICSRMFKIHNGLSLLGTTDSQLILTAINLYKQLSSESEMSKSVSTFRQTLKNKDSDIHLLYGFLTTFLTAVASTPCGLYALAQEDGILQDLLSSLFHPSSVSWDNPEFRLLVSLISAVNDGILVLSEMSCRLLSKPLCNLWSEFEDPIALMSGSDRKQVEATQYFMNIIFTFVPNLKGVMALFSEPDSSSEGTLVDTDAGPMTLSELLTFDNIEPWHYVSLLTLRALTTNMDVCLYLNSNLLFQEKLLKLQSENVTSGGEDADDSKKKPIIIDECSMLRHQILVSTYITGGSTERTIPPAVMDIKQLREYDELNLFCSLPPPQLTRNTARNIRTTRLKSQTEFHKFLLDTKDGVHDVNWLSHARRAYKASRNEDIKAHVLLELIEQVAKLSSNTESCLNLTWTHAGDEVLFPEEYLGIQVVIRYGMRCHLLQEHVQNEDNLVHLIQPSHSILKHTNNAVFQGFDWFIATMFLLSGGNLERCRSCIGNISSLPVTPFLWPALAASQVHSQSKLSESSAMFGHLLELLVKIELPHAFAALQLAGASWWLICQQWMAQCFWNRLDWSQICHWLVICILNQPDFTLYFCVSLLRHMQPQILQAASEGKVWEQIMLNPIEGFHVGDQLSFMEKLAKRYRTSVLHHLLGVSSNT